MKKERKFQQIMDIKQILEVETTHEAHLNALWSALHYLNTLRFSIRTKDYSITRPVLLAFLNSKRSRVLSSSHDAANLPWTFVMRGDNFASSRVQLV